MALAECQVQVRNLVMGPGTAYKVLPGFDPFSRVVRADQGGARAWNHGSWSGAEWMGEAVVPIPVSVTASSRAIGSWLPLHQALAAAFAPVGDAVTDVELRWMYGGVEYVMFGRPRMVAPQTEVIAVGKAVTQCAFVAQDPRIYSGELHTTAAVSLPTQIGGLTVPFTVPFTIDGTVVGGSVDIVNTGTTDTGMVLRIDGPVDEPRITLQRPDGSVQELRLAVTIPAGQWVEVDSAARTAFWQGLPEASARGQISWDMDSHPLQPGTNTLRFSATNFAAGTVTATWRSAWW